jgi:hypothetical protein
MVDVYGVHGMDIFPIKLNSSRLWSSWKKGLAVEIAGVGLGDQAEFA